MSSVSALATHDTTSIWLRRKRESEDAEDAHVERLFAALRPTRGRLIVSKPEVAAAHEQRKLDSGLYMPDRNSVFLREWGLRAIVLKMHPEDASAHLDGIVPGVGVVIGEHAGTPVYLARETPWWVISLIEVMAVVETGA